ncbi:MAG TPA: glycosyltransferase family 4 protein [Gemmatimonadota bacterium]
MNALHVVTAWPRHAGDVITPWLAETLRGLEREDVHCEVLAPAWRGGGARESGAIRVHRFRYAVPAALERLTHEETTPDRIARNPAWALLLPGYVAAACAAAARLQRRRRFDVVHVHWPVPHGLVGLAAVRAAPAALVTTFYGAEIRWAERAFPPARAFLKWYSRRGTLIAISTATRRALARYTARPIHVVPYPAALAPAPSAERRGGGGVLFVGRLVRRKGVDGLIRAAAASPRPYRVTVVGFGPEGPALRALAADLGVSERVEFTGRVGDDELARRYAAADLFVLPATLDERGDTEGLGVVLLEALAHGVPVVAAAVGGIPDVVEDGVTGLLVARDDPPALDAAIRRLLDDRALAGRLAAAGRARVAERFGVEAVARELARLYRAAAPAGATQASLHPARSG